MRITARHDQSPVDRNSDNMLRYALHDWGRTARLISLRFAAAIPPVAITWIGTHGSQAVPYAYLRLWPMSLIIIQMLRRADRTAEPARLPKLISRKRRET